MKDDPDCRMQFAKWCLILSEDNTTFLKTISWSNKAAFKLNGRVDRHNSVYWATKNPHPIQEELNLPAITVYFSVSVYSLVGSTFFLG